MAQWDGSTNSLIRPYRNPYGGAPVRDFQESTAAATAVLKLGDVVTFNTVVTTNLSVVRAP